MKPDYNIGQTILLVKITTPMSAIFLWRYTTGNMGKQKIESFQNKTGNFRDKIRFIQKLEWTFFETRITTWLTLPITYNIRHFVTSAIFNFQRLYITLETWKNRKQKILE